MVATPTIESAFKRIHMNLLDRVSQLVYLAFSLRRFKADNTNLASHLPRACLMLAQAGFPFGTVNTKEYHSECSGKISRIMCRTLVTTCELYGVQQVYFEIVS
ncbi:hypothetical protein Tco_0661150 [Tanacetum coccineum]